MDRKTLTLSFVAAFLMTTSSVLATDRLVPIQYPTIQAAIDAAVDGDIVIVAQDTYYENINFGGKSIAVTSTDPNDPNVVAGTVINANGSGTVVTFPDVENANCVLAGFTITGGCPRYEGGGIRCWDGTVTITSCTIAGNFAENHGGGICNYDGNLTLTKCIFSGNSACWGGGIYNRDGNLRLTNCTFSGNSAEGDGGGIYNGFGTLTLTTCAFNGNSAGHEGGGIINDYNSVTLSDCDFSENSALFMGGGMANSHYGATATNCTFSNNTAVKGGAIGTFMLYLGDLSVTNCTFVGNTADSYGGAVYNEKESNLTLSNCVLWGNSAREGPQIALWRDDILSISYSCLQGGQWDVYVGQDATLNWLTGNMDADPLFVDAANDDYHLLPGSPAIDTGDPNSDCTGEPWPNGFRVNMGAYGNTAEATRSPVDFEHLATFALYWLTDEPLVDIAPEPDGDGIANFLDFAALGHYWFWEQ